MKSLDKHALVDGYLTASQLHQVFDWYWKYFKFLIPWVGRFQVSQRGIVEPHEERSTDFYVRVMTDGPLGEGKAIASLTYRLVPDSEIECDLEAKYDIDRSTAYKTRRDWVSGKFILASAKIMNSSGPVVRSLFESYSELELISSDLSMWAESGNRMYIRCSNPSCVRQSEPVCCEPEEVREWATSKLTISELRSSLFCRVCQTKKPTLALYPFKGDRVIVSGSH